MLKDVSIVVTSGGRVSGHCLGRKIVKPLDARTVLYLNLDGGCINVDRANTIFCVHAANKKDMFFYGLHSSEEDRHWSANLSDWCWVWWACGAGSTQLPGNH